MKAVTPCILALNTGSSSIRFAAYDAGKNTRPCFAGKIERLGMSGTSLRFQSPPGMPKPSLRVAAHDPRKAVETLMDWLEAQPCFSSFVAVGHRIVHGMRHTQPERITPKLLAELHRIVPYDPEHLPRELALIEAVLKRWPHVLQVACFDTSFHSTMPRVARLLPIPRRFAALGIERYGFHGLSYTYLLEELVRLSDPAALKGRVILAHLGSGASLAAVLDGLSVDTSMGFTPSAGLVMGTRTGDLDPGVLSFLAKHESMTPTRFNRMINHESGLLGISDTSSDLRDLQSLEAIDVRASEAVALFCYQTKKWIGSYAAVLGGLDTLVFAGGIGENAASIRARICEGLGFLGVHLDKKRNSRHAALISATDGPVRVRVIHTDEELMIARSIRLLLA
jgi:acetate kinase